MSGKRSQAKGRNGEMELSRVLQGYGYNVTPGQPLNYGREPDLSGLPNIHIEAKRAEKLNLTAWVAQAKADAIKFNDGLPAVFHRRNRQEWLVTMPLSAWVELYKGGGPDGE